MKAKTTEKRQTKWYGWRPDLPDHRDKVMPTLSGTKRLASPLPSRVDMREHPAMSFELYDQGPLGSCTANAIGACFEFAQRAAAIALATPIPADTVSSLRKYDFRPSRLFVYYEERKMIGTVSEDSGAYIRDGFKVINNLGVCPESTWKYSVTKFKSKPPRTAYTRALDHQAIEYQRVPQDELTLKTTIAAKLPVVFGFSVYESFESDDVARTGDVSMPLPSEAMLGGHAVLCVGYDDERRRFICRNSWGSAWGDGGYFTMPYDYVLDPQLSDDLWAITRIEFNPSRKQRVRA